MSRVFGNEQSQLTRQRRDIMLAPRYTDKQLASLGRCAVTGGCGWTGSILVNALRESGVASVVALDVSVPEGEDATCCDITNADDAARVLADVDTVFHTVAFVDLRPTADVDFSMKLNVAGTSNVVQALISNGRPGVATLVNLGTSDVLMGAQLRCEDKTEDEVLTAPPSIYQKTKALAEAVVCEACRPSGEAESTAGRRALRGVTLRSPAIWGLQDRTYARMAPLPIGIGLPEARVDMIYVENLASALLHAAVRVNESPEEISGEAFNIRDGVRNMQQLYRVDIGGSTLGDAPSCLPHAMIGLARFLDSCAMLIHGLSGLQIQEPTGMTAVAMFCAWGTHTTNTAKAQRLLGEWPIVPHEVALERTRAALGIKSSVADAHVS